MKRLDSGLAIGRIVYRSPYCAVTMASRSLNMMGNPLIVKVLSKTGPDPRFPSFNVTAT